MNLPLTYQSSGVDIDAQERFIQRIKPLVQATRTALCGAELGDFAGDCALPPDLKEPILISGTDGVGTKLKVALLAEKHDTIGEDLVAMCVNDVLTSGAKPLFFLDYFSCDKLDVERATEIMSGIVRGCQKARCALLGGETAEMPGYYPEQHYDLAGFAVGVVEKSKRLGAHRVQAGDILLGLGSSGLHANGYSLTRKVLFDHANLKLDTLLEGRTLKEWLLEPTRIYSEAVEALLRTEGLRALCHVTGGGIVDNLPRILPSGLCATINEQSWPVPKIFSFIAEQGPVSREEMKRVYNLGLGMIAVLTADAQEQALEAMKAAGYSAWHIGNVVQSSSDGAKVVFT